MHCNGRCSDDAVIQQPFTTPARRSEDIAQAGAPGAVPGDRFRNALSGPVTLLTCSARCARIDDDNNWTDWYSNC